MSVKSDKWIRKMAKEHGMIEPFEDHQVRDGVISYGVSSYGYDMRVADEFKIFTNVNSSIVDPKHFDPKSFVEFKGTVCIVPPNSFALARSVEYFRIPRNCLTICVGKSTYARCGIIVNVTPFEPEWEGFVTLEISNTTPLPARIYANEGLCQVIFFESDEQCETSYKDKKGKIPVAAGNCSAENLTDTLHAAQRRRVVRAAATYAVRHDRVTISCKRSAKFCPIRP
jgi:dCTP deaminase